MSLTHTTSLLDTMAPTRVANLTAIDVEGQKEWPGTDNYPRLYFSWDKNTEDDLASMPYEVFISDLAPSAIEDMEKAGSTSDTSFYIDEYGGEPLVYEKDYWVAVIARDNAENYNDCFVAICGPVKVYEEMDSESSIYSTSTEGSGFLTGNENSGNLEDSALNTDSGFLIETKSSEKFGGKARSGIIINLIPQLNKTTLKHTKGDFLPVVWNQGSGAVEGERRPVAGAVGGVVGGVGDRCGHGGLARSCSS